VPFRAVAVRAIGARLFYHYESPKIFSMLMLILSVSPLFAPSSGDHYTMAFLAMGVYYSRDYCDDHIGLMRRFLPVVMSRTLPYHSRLVLCLTPMLRYCANREFLTFTLATSFALGGLFIYLAGSTVISPGTISGNASILCNTFCFAVHRINCW
jgi:DHA1 family bicyclomycin/chloramphenicol resistance-like MFS transporter